MICWHTNDTIRKPSQACQDASLSPAFVHLHQCHWAGRHSVDIQSSTASVMQERERENKCVSHSSVQQCSHPGKAHGAFFHTSTYQGHSSQPLGTQASFTCFHKASQLHLTPMRACLCESCLAVALSRVFKRSSLLLFQDRSCALQKSF